MAFDFLRSQTNTIQLTVLGLTGKPLTFPTDYTNPKVRISHVNGGGEIEDLAFIDMAQLVSSNRWFHKFTIPTLAAFTKYLVTFEATVGGIVTQSIEEYRVIQPTEAGGSPGVGEFSVTSEVRSSVNNQPISGVTVRIFDKSVPTVAIASTETDVNGKFTVFLDAGLYLIELLKTGVISEVHDLTVNGDGSHNIRGN